MDRNDKQQGSQSQQAGTQQQGGSSSTSAPRDAQQDQYSVPGGQQGGVPQQHQAGRGNVAQRGGGMPSLWGRGGPFELVRRLDEDMDRLFRQFWGGARGLARGAPGGGDVPQIWMPQLEMCERDGKLHVFADLPGMKKEDVKLSIDGDQLVIEGERRSGHDDTSQQQGGFFHTERSYGSFYRAISLPDGVDPATADASFKDGVLDVSFDAPKAQQPKSRRLEIR